MSVAVRINKVSVTLDGHTLIKDVSARLEPGVINALIGPNGAGKTTLINAMLGTLPYRGTIEFEGLDQPPRIGYVPQRAQAEPGAPLTVSDILTAGMTFRPVFTGSPKAIRERVLEVLDTVDIADRIDRRLDALSGGEFQRVLLAQALLRDPDMLILDEPNTGMDIIGHQLFCGLVERVHRKQQVTTLLVTHDMGVVADHAQRAIGLNRTIQFQGPVPDVLVTDNLVSLFGPHTLHLDTAHSHVHASPEKEA